MTQTSEVSTDEVTRDHANSESDSPTQALCQIPIFDRDLSEKPV